MKNRYTLSLPITLWVASLVGPADAQRLIPFGQGMVGSFGLGDAVVHNGRLVVGGGFSSFLGHLRNNLQGWDGQNHYDYPGAFTGPSQRVRALEVYNGELIAAGNDANVGHVARWDGSSWQPEGGGLGGTVVALAQHDGDLVAATVDDRVYRLSGTTWVALGPAFNAQVHALASYDGVLYAAGDFDQDVNSTPLRRLARWDGSAWQEVGGGLNGAARGLLATADGLVVAGGFTSDMAGSLTLPLWTVWDGTAFAEPAVGLPGQTLLEAVCAHPTEGFLLAGVHEALWVRGQTGARVRFRTLRAAVAFDGRVLLAGREGRSYANAPLVAALVEGVDEAYLDANNVKAMVTPTTNFFNRDSEARYEVPQGSGTHAVFSASPWLCGRDQGVLHTAAPMFSSVSAPQAGPYATVMDDAFLERYHQVWKVDVQMITNHQQHWNDPGYTMPHAIATWPGNGDVGNGEPARLAPFADEDADGVYEPQSGEFPAFPGTQAIFTILHAVQEPDSLLPLMPVDLLVMHYAYDAPGDPELHNSTITSVTFVNRGPTDYDDVRVGMFTDFDLGNYADDLAGCDSLRSITYVYNGDALDENGLSGPGYGADPPAQGTVLLSAPMSAHRMMTNAGTFPVPTMEDYFYGLENGTPFTQLGYPSHLECPGGTWTEATAGNPPGDRRTVATAGPFTLDAGGSLCLDLAFVHARATGGGPLASVDSLLLRAEAVRSWYAGTLGCAATQGGGQSVVEVGAGRLIVFPNPAADRVTLELDQAVPGALVRLLDPTGRVLRQECAQGARHELSVHELAAGTYYVRVDGLDRALSATLLVVH